MRKIYLSLKEMFSSLKTKEIMMDTPLGRTYVKIFSPKLITKKPPLLIIHGGPGATHNYLLELATLSNKQSVIFYDQIGCGLSLSSKPITDWKVEIFIDEVFHILTELNLSAVNMLGHSWGATVAAEFYLKYPKLVNKIILASPFLSSDLWCKDADNYIAQLPLEHKLTLEIGNENQNYYSPEYKNSLNEYYKRHVYFVDPPPIVFKEIEKTFGLECYNQMWGPNEFTITGSLTNYNFVDNLKNIKIPCLYTCGRFDEASPNTISYFSRETPNSTAEIFENSAHFPHITESNKYIESLINFL